MSISRPFHFFTVVWGSRFVRQFLEVCLPTFLAGGNLGAFGKDSGDRYYLYTALEDVERIREHAAFKCLTEQLPVHLHCFEDERIHSQTRIDYRDAWKVVNELYRGHITNSSAAGAALCLLEPDSVWAEGSLKRLREIVDSGKRVIIVFSCHTRPQKIIPKLLQHKQNGKVAISVSNRTLVQYAIESFHPYSSCHDWNAQNFWNPGPGNFFWRVEGEGFIEHSTAGSNQVIVFPKDAPAWPIEGGFEFGSYIEKLFNRDEIYVSYDSDEMISVGLESAQEGDPDYKLNEAGMRYPASPLRVAEWIARSASPFGSFLFSKPICWRCAEPSDAWQRVDRERQKVVNMLLDLAELIRNNSELAKDITDALNGKETELCQVKSSLESALGCLDAILSGKPVDGLEIYALSRLLVIRGMAANNPPASYQTHLVRCIESQPQAAPALIQEVIEHLASRSQMEEALQLGEFCQRIYEHRLRMDSSCGKQ